MRGRRFYTAVSVGEDVAGYVILLDSREVRSPAGGELVLANRALAEAVADEWRAQEDEIVPRTMPLMSLVATAVDRVVPRRGEVVDAIARYARTDLLSYRAEAPAELVARQCSLWDPLLEWCAERTRTTLAVTAGVMPAQQSPDVLEAIAALVADRGDLELVALHELVTLTGSVVIGLAVAEGRISGDEAAAAAQLDETWQAGRWGEDEEAQERRDAVRRDLLAAERLLRLCRSVN